MIELALVLVVIVGIVHVINRLIHDVILAPMDKDQLEDWLEGKSIADKRKYRAEFRRDSDLGLN